MRLRITGHRLNGSTFPELQGTSTTAGYLVSQAAVPSLQEAATFPGFARGYLWASCMSPLELTSHRALSMSVRRLCHDSPVSRKECISTASAHSCRSSQWPYKLEL